jgi:hypothetical protein
LFVATLTLIRTYTFRTTNVRTVLTYASETRAETTYTPTTSPDYRDEDNKGDTWKDAYGQNPQ